MMCKHTTPLEKAYFEKKAELRQFYNKANVVDISSQPHTHNSPPTGPLADLTNKLGPMCDSGTIVQCRHRTNSEIGMGIVQLISGVPGWVG